MFYIRILIALIVINYIYLWPLCK